MRPGVTFDQRPRLRDRNRWTKGVAGAPPPNPEGQRGRPQPQRCSSLTRRTCGMSVEGADLLDAQSDSSLNENAASGQTPNAPSGRRMAQHARYAVPPCVLGSSRNHRRRGVGSRFLHPHVLSGSHTLVKSGPSWITISAMSPINLLTQAADVLLLGSWCKSDHR